MKLLIVLAVMMALAVSSASSMPFDEEDWSMHSDAAVAAEGLADEMEPVAEPVVESEDFVTELMAEEVSSTTAATTTTTTTTASTTTESATTRKPSIKKTTTTASSKSVVVVTATEETEVTTSKPKSRGSKASNRGQNRLASSRRGQSAKTAVEEEDVVVVAEEETMGAKVKSTSPSSLDTASISILAPKSFKPTSRPAAATTSSSTEEENPKDLMDFLRRRKIERIQATTTVDPFIAILATATPPNTEEPVTFAVEKSSSGGRFSGGRRPSIGSGRGRGSSRSSTTTTTTTEAPVTEASTESSRRTGLNRFSGRRSTTTATTTTAQPTVDEPQVETTTKSKLQPKRPVTFRPIANAISRRRDQSTTTAAPTEDSTTAAPAAEEIEVETTTRRSFRRASGRLMARSNSV